MKKVILTLSIIATLFSCTTEEIATTEAAETEETQEEVSSKFTGVYEMTKFIRINTETGEATINVVLDCPQIWDFQEDFNLNKRVYGLRGEDCVYKYMEDSKYLSLEEGVVFLGEREFEVFYREDSVVLQEVSGNLNRDQYTFN